MTPCKITGCNYPEGECSGACCCTHDCGEGRTCPARVAKIGQRMPGPEPITGTSWRDYLPDLARAMLLVVGVIVISVVATVAVVGAA